MELEVYKKSDFYEDYISSQKEYYERANADAYFAERLAEKDREIAKLKEKLMPCLNGDCILTCEVVEKYGKENAELKAKLENVQASMYADVVDANMENRRLKRALWLARAKRAFDCKEIFRLELRINELKQTYVGSGYYMVMINKWQNVERKFLKKAEEYK